MNKYGIITLLTFVIGVTSFLIARGPGASLAGIISALSLLSVIGLFAAIRSKQRWYMITGIFLNTLMLVYAFFLLLAFGLGG